MITLEMKIGITILVWTTIFLAIAAFASLGATEEDETNSPKIAAWTTVFTLAAIMCLNF